MPHDYLTVRELREMLHVSRATAYRTARQLPHIRIGRAIRVSRRGLESYLRAHDSPRSRLGAALDPSQRSASLLPSPRCADGGAAGGRSLPAPVRSALAPRPLACKMCAAS